MNNIDLANIQESVRHINSGDLNSEIRKMINGSTLDEKTLTFLGHLTGKVSPQVILELGSGTSTSLFASYLKKNKNTHLISVDNFEYFVKDAVEKSGARQQITSTAAPISFCFFKGCPIVTYSKKLIEILKKYPKVELVLIDGPNGRIFWRESVLVLLAAYIHKDALIILDDSARPREQKSLKILRYLFGSAIEIKELSGFRKGLTLIRLNEALPKSYSLNILLSRYLELPRTFIAYLKYKKSVNKYIRSICHK